MKGKKTKLFLAVCSVFGRKSEFWQQKMLQNDFE